MAHSTLEHRTSHLTFSQRIVPLEMSHQNLPEPFLKELSHTEPSHIEPSSQILPQELPAQKLPTQYLLSPNLPHSTLLLNLPYIESSQQNFLTQNLPTQNLPLQNLQKTLPT